MVRRDDDETASRPGTLTSPGKGGVGGGPLHASAGRSDAARIVGLVLLLWLAGACRGSEQAAPGGAATATGGSAVAGGSAGAGSAVKADDAAKAGGAAKADGAVKADDAAKAGGSATGSGMVVAGGSAAAPAGSAATTPATLVDELRALPRTAGDRAKATALHKQALKVHAAHKLADAERTWAEAARADPSWNVPFYNLACATALQARPRDAIAYLEMLRDRDPNREMLWRVEHDGELESIRSRPEYEALVIEIEDGVRDQESMPAGGGSGGAASTTQERRPR